MSQSSPRSAAGSLVVIAAVVGGLGVAFAYAGGFLSPGRLTPQRLVAELAPPGGPALGHRRNHAKGVCFTGRFEANGAGAELSRAQVFTAGAYPVVGRFNIGTPSPVAVDGQERVRGISLKIDTPDGQEWRSAMIDAPVFPVSTPQAFHELLVAAGKKDPGAMKDFAAAHPEIAGFGGWAGSAPFLESYAEEHFYSLNSFLFVDGSGAQHAVRWALTPQAAPVAVAPADLAKRSPDFLQTEIAQRVGAAPARWTLDVTVAEPGDPTADPSKVWPATRRTVTVGTLVADKVLPEPDGPCRDINYDPTILPGGIRTSDDPFPAARSSAYAVSFDRRTAEARAYPATSQGNPR